MSGDGCAGLRGASEHMFRVCVPPQGTSCSIEERVQSNTSEAGPCVWGSVRVGGCMCVCVCVHARACVCVCASPSTRGRGFRCLEQQITAARV